MFSHWFSHHVNLDPRLSLLSLLCLLWTGPGLSDWQISLDDLIRFCSLSALLRGVVRYHFVYFLEPWLALLHSSIFFRLLSPAWPAFSCSRPSSFMFCFSKCYINSAMTSLSSSVQDSPIFSAWWFNQRSLPVGSSAHVSPVRLDYPEQREDPDTKCDELIIDMNDSNDIFDC